jgi:hypothetical protein
LARIAGHNPIAKSSRYVHPSADKILDAMVTPALLGGHKMGHSEVNPTTTLEMTEISLLRIRFPLNSP